MTASHLETAPKGEGEGEGRGTLSWELLPRIQQAGFPQNSREGPRTGMGASSEWSINKSL